MDEDLKDKLEEIFKIKTFSQNIYYDIFKIFKEKGEPYSNNSNGVFINLNDCKHETIKEVYDYIENVEKNNLQHEIYLQNTEKKLDDLKKSIKDTEKKDTFVKKTKTVKRKNNVSSKILDKELQQEKVEYKGVYKRIYNCMKGYKNKPLIKKEQVKDEQIELETEADAEVELEEIEEIDFEDLNKDDDNDLFGEESEDEVDV